MACGYGACYGCVVEIDGAAQAALRRGTGARGRACSRARGGGRVRILNASGCLDALAAPEVARQLDAFVTKTVTPLPREGSAPPRIAETAHGMLNAIGLANPGRERFLVRAPAAALRELGVPLWVSRRRLYAADYAETCSRSDAGSRGDRAQPLVPERRRSGGLGGGDRRGVPRHDGPAALREALGRAPRRRGGRARGRRGRRGRALARSTRFARQPSTETLRPVLARGSGGLSGPALKPVALHAVSVCHEATGLPIVGMGGIQSGRDALEFAACGARDVALGTVLFGDPGAPARVRAELATACADAGVAKPEDAGSLAKSPETVRKVPA